MSTYKKANYWYVNIRFNRTRYRKKSPENSQAGAKAYESVLRQKLSRGEDLSDVGKVSAEVPTFSKFSADWLKQYAKANNKNSEFENKESILRSNLLPFFNGLRLDEISNRNIEEYKAIKVNYGLRPKTINNHLTVLRKCLGTAQEWGLVEHLPKIKMLRVDPPKTTYLTTEECQRLLSGAEGKWYEMIYVALNTGLRFGELTALMWVDVDFERKILTIQRALYHSILGSTKSNRIRKIPLTDGVLGVLASKKKTKGYIFCHDDGSLLTHSSCRKKLMTIAKVSGIEKMGWHKLRHTFASNLANRGVAIQQIQALLGHTDIKTSMRYSHISSASLVEAIDKLQENDNFGHPVDTNPIEMTNYRRQKILEMFRETA